MKLTDAKIHMARVKRRPMKLADGRGMYLLINPNGTRWWRLKYRFGGREKCISLGVYPEVSLNAARSACDRARTLLREGKDPSQERQAKKREAALSEEDLFASAYARYEIELNLAHRKIEALERENADLRRKNHRLTRELALSAVRRQGSAQSPQGSQESP